MVLDFGGCWLVEVLCKALFADLAPKPIILQGRERREKRRAEQLRLESFEQSNGIATDKKKD